MDINESASFNATNYIPIKVVFSHFFEFFIYIISISNRTRCRLITSYSPKFFTFHLTLIFIVYTFRHEIRME